ncbi:MAG TPA: MOP flippase family protein [Gammaproteobacteria bacterium]|nr:MOP flippase family protein [Gammaproteobacteria bacterium]
MGSEKNAPALDGEPAGETPKALGVSATRGVFWTGGGQAVRQVIQVVSSIVLARLLEPSDFGLLGMAIVFVGVGQLFADFGIGSAIVQSKQVREIELTTSFWANLLFAGLLALLLVMFAPLVADFYEDERVIPVLAVLAAGLLISGATVVPRAILYKNLKFGMIAKAQVLGSALGAVTAVTMAWQGFGVWSLVAQPLCGSLVNVSLTLRYSRWWPGCQFSWKSITHLVTFSANVLGADLLNYAHRNGDKLIVGKYLGSVSLGYYSMAYQLMLYPLSQVSSVIVKVLFPTLSQMQDDKARYRSAYLKSVSAISIVTFPMMAGLFVISDDFVLLVFGEKWMPMVPVLEVLCWVGMLQSISTTVGIIYLSTGKVKRGFYFTLFATPVMLVAIVIGLSWGLTGAAIGYAIASTFVAYANYFVAFPIIGLTVREFHRYLARPFAACLLMFAAVFYFHDWVSSSMDFDVAQRVTMSVGVGVVAYVASSLMINRRHINDVASLVKASLTKS